MAVTWYCLLAFLAAGWIILDGYDFGLAIIYLGVAKSEIEKKQVLQTIKPLWDGNQVWLIAFGAALVFSFPGLYASAFSGLYLPLFILLWLLMARAISIELRDSIEYPFWETFWDWCLVISSALTALFAGIALGNFPRGFPIDPEGYFFLPLWTDLTLGSRPGIIDWYTVSMGLLVVVALVLHGSVWIVFRTDGNPHRRALMISRLVWPLAVILTIVSSAMTFAVSAQVRGNFQGHPWGILFPAIAILGLSGAGVFSYLGRAVYAFHLSALYLLGMFASLVFGIFPYVLPAYRSNSDAGLTIFNAGSVPHSLLVGLCWFIPGMLVVIGYTLYAHVLNAGKVKVRNGEIYVSGDL